MYTEFVSHTLSLRGMYELQVRAAVLLCFGFFSTVDLPIHQRVSHRLEDRHLGPLGLAPNLTLERVVIYDFLCEDSGQRQLNERSE